MTGRTKWDAMRCEANKQYTIEVRTDQMTKRYLSVTERLR
jgi:hypothetical protein